MNKQQEIREGIQELIFESWDKPVKSADLAWDIIAYLHSQGCVIRVEGYVSGTIVNCPNCHCAFLDNTEPLIKECDE